MEGWGGDDAIQIFSSRISTGVCSRNEQDLVLFKACYVSAQIHYSASARKCTFLKSQVSSFSAWFLYHDRRILKMVCLMHDPKFEPWAVIFLGVHQLGWDWRSVEMCYLLMLNNEASHTESTEQVSFQWTVDFLLFLFVDDENNFQSISVFVFVCGFLLWFFYSFVEYTGKALCFDGSPHDTVLTKQPFLLKQGIKMMPAYQPNWLTTLEAWMCVKFVM